MKSTTLTTCLLAVLAIAGSGAASAQTAAVQADVNAPAPAVQANPPAQPLAQADREPEPVNDSRCLRETGSLIKQRDKSGKPGCIQQSPGRSYTRDDISRTGQTDLSDALRTLDPSIH